MSLFSVNQRDTFHFDIVVNGNRAFRIRGEYPKFVVLDERDFSIRTAELTFETVNQAMSHICQILMKC